jgi:hypothetical protein
MPKRAFDRGVERLDVDATVGRRDADLAPAERPVERTVARNGDDVAPEGAEPLARACEVVRPWNRERRDPDTVPFALPTRRKS